MAGADGLVHDDDGVWIYAWPSSSVFQRGVCNPDHHVVFSRALDAARTRMDQTRRPDARQYPPYAVQQGHDTAALAVRRYHWADGINGRPGAWHLAARLAARGAGAAWGRRGGIPALLGAPAGALT